MGGGEREEVDNNYQSSAAAVRGGILVRSEEEGRARVPGVMELAWSEEEIAFIAFPCSPPPCGGGCGLWAAPRWSISWVYLSASVATAVHVATLEETPSRVCGRDTLPRRDRVAVTVSFPIAMVKCRVGPEMKQDLLLFSWSWRPGVAVDLLASRTRGVAELREETSRRGAILVRARGGFGVNREIAGVPSRSVSSDLDTLTPVFELYVRLRER
ncbi:hypothetical protein Taro_026117 [Colocasia esculenta]|uniref:Uncharacterized protein n=1 Tax=Colocasia esculenta TaxID=4460 RepID=A0A843VG75_COLES|nr:hypothetical protein [Colocasia esculenta]